MQGLADTFIQMGFPFASDTAKDLNRLIFETMYHAALEQSCELAREEGYYETFPGSPARKENYNTTCGGSHPRKGAMIGLH